MRRIRRVLVTSHLLAWHLEAFTWKIQMTAGQTSGEADWVSRANAEIAPLRPQIRKGSDLRLDISLGTVAVLILAMAEYILIMEESEDPVYAGRMLSELSALFDHEAGDPNLPRSSVLIQRDGESGWPSEVLTQLFAN